MKVTMGKFCLWGVAPIITTVAAGGGNCGNGRVIVQRSVNTGARSIVSMWLAITLSLMCFSRSIPCYAEAENAVQYKECKSMILHNKMR